ncbi:response regulator [Oceanispirochaeta crateris]|uniref:Response regulator n=1 Tax=Oceanispirochaeta crateris TaxID=2518645 RepID=A0A5C1QPB0_9SPIO|nr:response regulator [Oceanispirochaeta crateris]QEN09521.1 response regulator [Oceanispirochaeta crateris]
MSKYTLLLADDEQIIRDGISRKIKWEEEGFIFLPPCEDGESAIQSVREHQPDVVITDICMPGRDGLEVAKYIAENSPDTLVIILSGYEDFDYARQALLANVHEYILKPLSSRKIHELLQRIREELTRRKAFQLDMSRLLQLQEEHKQSLRERFLCRVLTRPIKSEEIQEYHEILQGQNPEMDYYCALVMDLDSPGKVSPTVLTQDLYLLAVREEAEKLKEKVPRIMICQPPEPAIYIILRDENENSLNHTARYTAEQLAKTISVLPDFSMSIGLGRSVRGMDMLYQSSRQARRALENRLIMGDRSVFFYQDSVDRIGDRNNRFLQNADRLMNALKQQSAESVSDLVRDFIFILRESGLSPLRIRLEISKFTFRVIDFLGSLEDSLSYDDIFLLSESLASIAGLDNLVSVEEALDSCLMEVSGLLKENRKKFPEKKIGEIQVFLEKEYASPNITVETITSQFFISPSYLSKLFRQFMDKTFVEYLTGLRVSKACELLKTSDKKLFEIAEMVGYSDSRYFSSIFKKYMGMTPSQFRNKL